MCLFESRSLNADWRTGCGRPVDQEVGEATDIQDQFRPNYAKKGSISFYSISE